ncbi:hypothetical protein GQ457_07G037020 [Hibiscus cannabinus]
MNQYIIVSKTEQTPITLANSKHHFELASLPTPPHVARSEIEFVAPSVLTLIPCAGGVAIAIHGYQDIAARTDFAKVIRSVRDKFFTFHPENLSEVFCRRPVTNFDKITCHLIECIHYHLQNSKGQRDRVEYRRKGIKQNRAAYIS